MSVWPCRAAPNNWPAIAFGTGRIQVVSRMIHGIWVTGVIVYGFAMSHSQAADRTDTLLQLAEDRIGAVSGCRFIAGDFNLDLRAPDSTDGGNGGLWNCRRKPYDDGGGLFSRLVLDHLWMSPELSSRLRSVHSSDQWFCDHAILYGQFSPD